MLRAEDLSEHDRILGARTWLNMERAERPGDASDWAKILEIRDRMDARLDNRTEGVTKTTAEEFAAMLAKLIEG